MEQSTVAIDTLRNRWSATLDTIEHSDVPITILRLDEPYVVALGATVYGGLLKTLGLKLPPPADFPIPGRPLTDKEAFHALPGWLAADLLADPAALVPARFALDARNAYRALRIATYAVRWRFLHLIVRRYGADTAAFVPLQFADHALRAEPRNSEPDHRPPHEAP
jgi:hypothetical protein